MSGPTERLQALEPARICIIKPSSLGDVVHAMPILACLRDKWPHAHIAWVVNRAFRDLLDKHRDVNELIVYETRGSRPRASDVERTVSLFRRLAREPFDLTIDLQGLLRSALMTAATRAKTRIGLADAREGARWFYTHRVDAPRLGIHAVDRALRVAAALGAGTVEPRFNVSISQADCDWANKLLAETPGPRVLLNLGARWLTKRWPPVHFAEIGRRAVKDFGASLIAVGSRGDQSFVDELAFHLGSIPLLDLCGQTRLPQLAALTLECDLMISNDTGPLHLAAAAGARVLGIYTCTNPKLTGPYGPHAATVQSCVWCAPSFLKTCRRLDCMTELSPDRVWPAVRDQLESTRAFKAAV
jgi:lipopolysaccharide heptosyltransferase I